MVSVEIRKVTLEYMPRLGYHQTEQHKLKQRRKRIFKELGIGT